MNSRIESVDILRGFTIALMILVNTPRTWSAVFPPLLHAKWHGLRLQTLSLPSSYLCGYLNIFRIQEE
jgi:predicted acyltransferase